MSESTIMDNITTQLSMELGRVFDKYGVSEQDSEEIYLLLVQIDEETDCHNHGVADLKKQLNKVEEEKLHILSEIDTVSTTVLAAHKLLNSVCSTTEKIVKRKQVGHSL